MTWLTWRQHRSEAACVLIGLLAFGASILILTLAGSGLGAEIVRHCQPNSQGMIPNACGSLPAQFSTRFQQDWWWVVAVGTVIPALFGMFVGAPMIAREVENGTHLLIWSQGISRRRWFVSRFGLVVFGTVVGAAALAAAGQGWFAMQRALGSPLSLSSWDGFEIGAPVIIAYTIFALALGVAAGALIRRTVPAMAATLLGFIAIRVAIAFLSRPFYVSPLTARASLAASQSGFDFGPGGPNASSAWSVGPTVMTDAAGHEIPGGFCVGSGSGCLSHVTAIQHYQPGDRFWLFQSIEATIFVALAVGLYVLAYRFVMRIR